MPSMIVAGQECAKDIISQHERPNVVQNWSQQGE